MNLNRWNEARKSNYLARQIGEVRRARVAKDSDGICGAAVCGIDLPGPFIPGCSEGERCDPPAGTCRIADAGVAPLYARLFLLPLLQK